MPPSCFINTVRHLLPQVQVALHANQSADLVDWRWVFCNHDSPLSYQEEDLQLSMLPLYDSILSMKSSKLQSDDL